MNEIQIFQNAQFGKVRTINKNGEPWFVATDICAVLDIKNPTQAMQRLDSDERAMFNIGRQGNTSIVNEPGLYSLILGSRKPEAHAFKRWITHDVIPAIRKTGAYVNPAATITIDTNTLGTIIGITISECLKQLKPLMDKETPKSNQRSEHKDVFTERFNQLLQKYNMTPADAARLLNKSRTSVHYWTSGKYAPLPANLKLIASKMGVSIDFFYGDEP